MPVMKCGRGVNKDLPPAELELGVWTDANCFRFKDGCDEKMLGIAEIMTSPSITSYALFPYQISGTRYLVEAGIAAAYAHNGSSRTQITRGKTAQTISSIVDKAGAGSTRVLTTSTAHGLSTGDVVVVSGCTGADAAMYNTSVSGASITVTSSTVFEYMGSSSSTPAGAATGSPIYVIASSTVIPFTGAIDDKWTGGHLAGMLILNNPVDGLFYWNGDTAQLLRPFSITTYVADVGRPHREWFFQAAPTISGTKYPRRVIWSDAAVPGSLPTTFTAGAGVDAGAKELDDTNGFIVDIFSLGEELHVYKDDQRYAFRWIGGTEVFDAEPIHDASGLMARGCVANTDDGRQVFLTKSCDVRIHSGGMSESLAQGRVLNYLRGDIDSTYKTRAFLTTNPYSCEIWVCYPRSGSSTCNGAIVWNWKDNTWAIAHRGLSITAGAVGLLPTTIATDRRMVIATSTPKLGLVDSGTTDLGATITATLERTGLHFDDFDRVKMVRQSRIQADATAANTASVYHGGAMTADATPTYSSAVTFTVGTSNKVSAHKSGRFLAWKLSTTATDWKHRSVEIDVIAKGKS